MSTEKIQKELEYYAALYCFEIFDVTKIKHQFDLLMMDGIFFDEFIDIEYPQGSRYKGDIYSSDFITPFMSVLKKLNYNIPKDQEEAVWVILKYHIQNIAGGGSNPIEEMQQLKSAIGDFIYTRTIHFLGDSHGIDKLLGWYYTDFDPEGTANMADNKKNQEELEHELVKEALNWLKNYI